MAPRTGFVRHSKEYNQDYYMRNRVARLSDRRRRNISFSELIDQLKNRPCMDCQDWFPPECMDFDHRPGTEKVNEISRMQSNGRSVIMSEIAKCDVVCANCHRIRTKSRGRLNKVG